MRDIANLHGATLSLDCADSAGGPKVSVLFPARAAGEAWLPGPVLSPA